MMRANSPQQTPLLQKGTTSGKASSLAQQRRKEAWGIEGEGPSPYGAAILNSTRKEIAMSDKEKVALTKLTSKGG